MPSSFNPLNPRGRNPLGYNPNDVGQFVPEVPKRSTYNPLREAIRTRNAYTDGYMDGMQQQQQLDMRQTTNPGEKWFIDAFGEYKEPPQTNITIKKPQDSNAIDEGYGSGDANPYDDELYS
jgi:hypothetical protein